MNWKNEITILIPTYNEEESINFVIDELLNLNFKNIIVIDGGSKDNTLKNIKKYEIEVIKIGYRSGYGDAFIRGVSRVKTKYLCKLNADGSFNPKYIDQMFNLLRLENYDIVFNSRYLSKAVSEDDTIIRRIGNFLFTNLCRVIFFTMNTDILYNYHMSSTSNYKQLNLKFRDFSICTEIPIKSKWLRFKVAEIPSNERERFKGISKVNAFKDGLKILLSTLSLLFKK